MELGCQCNTLTCSLCLYVGVRVRVCSIRITYGTLWLDLCGVLDDVDIINVVTLHVIFARCNFFFVEKGMCREFTLYIYICSVCAVLQRASPHLRLYSYR